MRIVINSWGSYGDVYPYIGSGKALKAGGHHVTLALPRYYVPMVEREGLEARAVGPDIDPNDRERIAAVMDPAKGPERLIRGWLTPALRAAIVVPHSHDQPDNAFRVTTLGVARTIFPGAYRAARVARELSRLLGDASYMTRAAALAESVRSEDGARAAADAIVRAASGHDARRLRAAAIDAVTRG